MQYRDTDRDWEKMAEQHPYFSVITDPKFYGTKLDPEVKRDFFQSGEHQIAHVLQTIRSHFAPDFQP